MYFFGYASKQTEFGLKLSWVLLDDWLIPQRQGSSYVGDNSRVVEVSSTILNTLRDMYEDVRVFGTRAVISEHDRDSYYIPLCLHEDDEAYMCAYTNGVMTLFRERPFVFKSRV